MSGFKRRIKGQQSMNVSGLLAFESGAVLNKYASKDTFQSFPLCQRRGRVRSISIGKVPDCLSDGLYVEQIRKKVVIQSPS